jgi:hypothetical protein
MSQRGAISVKMVITTVGIVVMVFLAIIGTEVYFDHSTMVEKLRNLTTDDLIKPDKNFHAKALQMITDVDANFTDQDLQITYGPTRYSVEVLFSYHRPLDLKIVSVPIPFSVSFHVERSEMKGKMDNIVHSYENLTNTNSVDQRVNTQPMDDAAKSPAQ